MKISGIYRERIFSPGKVREDAAILDTVLDALSCAGHETLAMTAESMDEGFENAGLILSMAQSERVLARLELAEKSGIPVVNTVSAVRGCYRKALIETLALSSVPMPAGRVASMADIEASGSFGKGYYWMKRGDFHALGQDDVVRIGSRADLSSALAHFRGQGVDQVLIQEHVAGPCVKFYGVGAAPGCFFRAFLSASGEEITARAGRLSETARAAAECVGLEIYGGDAIIADDGTAVLIDLNDWPTFSLCRAPAVQAIVEYLACRIEHKGAHNGIS